MLTVTFQKKKEVSHCVEIFKRTGIYLAEFVLERHSLSPASLIQKRLQCDDPLFKILHLALQGLHFAGELSLEQSRSSLPFPLPASFHLLRSFG
jgi:hypothetical protein